ncbi:MAG: 2-oxoglutarate dehydrogenase complex dihydrolipoyllysine-residue succinyltransferase [Chitinophagales bacterium]|nr:2-oxoglutarate dehydrogenase complex dihydrolipoyllysine-residue succinyltransferase [Chitinophagales bacterium]MCO5279665.1 2-oxoglutarate dehydrogenase complex dihydrolipoyllysine-residue succinyltransferase [Chitinophagales bacterium]OJV29136.1 MAG: dihydrolipoamide succinyltransferase [Bacteroidetes bacterium 37-13]HRN93086.1 2-oxoglutarate dehydrogenase complex dihydrolipoyllysine-residue succinyltransferase [Chitinophagales bacterium]HRP39816.1 2-oxoglutarate dehydrogenase complex dihy
MTEVKVPALAESITEVTLSKWLVKSGDYVELDQPICELETDKASQELPSPVAGVVTLVANEGDDIKVGGLLAKIDEAAAKPASVAAPAAEKKVETPKEAPKAKVAETKAETKIAATSNAAGHPSPAAKKILDEGNVKTTAVSGTGVGGRITKDDAIKAVRDKANLPTREAFSRNERVEKMSRLRRTISERLVYAKNSTAMLTTFNEADMSAINKIRDKYGDAFKKKNDLRLGMMSFFTKAVCLALEKYPAVNAYIDEGNIIYHDYVDISIAVSTPKGLVVPVIRNAESLSLAGIEQQVRELAIKGRDGLLTMEDMTGGTFTISNGGVFGSLMSTPIINPPQSAILGMHKVEDRPVVVDGQIVVRPMMYLALSYDHRIIDGKESVSFLVAVKDYLENPQKMLLGADPVELLLEL